MIKALVGFSCILFLCSCTDKQTEGFASKTSTNTGLTCQNDDTFLERAIYGEDNRLDWFESPGLTKDYWAKATLALIPAGMLAENEGVTSIVSGTYAEAAGLCPGQPFSEQPSAAYCSGFLVAEDLVVTAGHCISDNTDCESTRFVFDFAKTSAEQTGYQVPSESVYSCAEIVVSQRGRDDFAVIRLDRKVEDRVPLNLRREGILPVGDQVMLIGHPMGLPSKIADGGFVDSVGEKIIASVDAFAANSGSVILNSQTGFVEGILVAGEPDFRFENGCRVEAVCGASCSGEVITPIAKVLDYIPNIIYENPVCPL